MGVFGFTRFCRGIWCGWKRGALLYVHLLEDLGGLMDHELVLEEELDVSSASEGAPVRPCTVSEVEEGNIGNSRRVPLAGAHKCERRIVDHIHWNRCKWCTYGHANETPDESLAMQPFSLGAELVQHVRDSALRYQGRRVVDLDLVGALELIVGALGGQGRDGLEAPFLVGYPAQGLVAILDDSALPA